MSWTSSTRQAMCRQEATLMVAAPNGCRPRRAGQECCDTPPRPGPHAETRASGHDELRRCSDRAVVSRDSVGWAKRRLIGSPQQTPWIGCLPPTTVLIGMSRRLTRFGNEILISVTSRRLRGQPVHLLGQLTVDPGNVAVRQWTEPARIIRVHRFGLAVLTEYRLDNRGHGVPHPERNRGSATHRRRWE